MDSQPCSAHFRGPFQVFDVSFTCEVNCSCSSPCLGVSSWGSSDQGTDPGLCILSILAGLKVTTHFTACLCAQHFSKFASTDISRTNDMPGAGAGAVDSKMIRGFLSLQGLSLSWERIAGTWVLRRWGEILVNAVERQSAPACRCRGGRF